MKKNKAPGPDEIVIELIEKSSALQDRLHKITNKIWDEHQVPENLVQGDTIMIHKKNNENDPANYRPITLLNHSFKVITKILNNRLKPLKKQTTPHNQCGFRL